MVDLKNHICIFTVSVFVSLKDSSQIGESAESSFKAWPKPPDVGGTEDEYVCLLFFSLSLSVCNTKA